MRRLSAALIIFILIITSCEDNEITVSPKISNYYFGFMHYPLSTIEDPDTDNLVELSYEGDKVVKRIGGVIPINPLTGYNYSYSEIVFDDVFYSPGQITIILHKVQMDDSTYLLESSTIYMDNQYRMERKEIFNTYSNSTDTIFYTYDGSGKLVQSERKTPFSSVFISEASSYYYSALNNLDSIITNVKIEDEFLEKKRELFRYYDGASNPLKKLGIFEELFFRSLSNNNFRKYEMYKYDTDGNLLEEEERYWELTYDKEGNIEFYNH